MLAGKGHLLMEHQPVQTAIGGIVTSWLSKNLYTGTNAAAPPSATTTVSATQSSGAAAVKAITPRAKTKFSGVYVHPAASPTDNK
jgi:hypothetical protein